MFMVTSSTTLLDAQGNAMGTGGEETALLRLGRAEQQPVQVTFRKCSVRSVILSLGKLAQRGVTISMGKENPSISF